MLRDSIIAVALGPLLGAAVAWLSSLDARVWRLWMTHPWVTYWILSGLFYVFVRAGMFSRFLDLPIASVLLYTFLSAVALSMVQGLRMSWRRAPWRAVAIVVVVTMFLVYDALSSPPDLRAIHVYGFASLVPAWLLAAIVAEFGARWIKARKKVDV